MDAEFGEDHLQMRPDTTKRMVAIVGGGVLRCSSYSSLGLGKAAVISSVDERLDLELEKLWKQVTAMRSGTVNRMKGRSEADVVEAHRI